MKSMTIPSVFRWIGTIVVSILPLQGWGVGSGLAFGSCPTPNFAPQVVVPAGGIPYSISAADFDGDGRTDLAVANFRASTVIPGAVSILLGDGHGSLGAPASFTAGLGPTSLLASDLDADGRPDVVVVNEFQGAVSVLLGDGHGRLGPQSLFATGDTPAGLAIGDFDEDGDSDIVVANFFGARVSVLLGDGHGSFEVSGSYPVGIQPLSVAAGDLDHDGRLDLAVANNFDATVSILLGHGDGSFGPGATFDVPGLNDLRSLAMADFDRDGVLDLVVVNAFNRTVVVFRGKGDGSLGPPIGYPVGRQPIFVTVGDVNGDEKPDLIVGDADDNTVSILLGKGDGGFSPRSTLTAGTTPFPVALVDLNGDGALDLAVGNFNDRTLSIFLNQCVVDRPPQADAGADRRYECVSPAGAPVLLDASASTDADSAPGENDDIARFEWFEHFGEPSQVLLGTGELLETTLALGIHVATLRVTDRAGAVDTDQVVIAVQDTVPPALSVSLSHGILWPPDHRLVDVETVVSATDTCGTASVVLASLVSNEPDDAPGPGDGNTQDDVQGSELGTPDFGFLLRAERDGAGQGRTYRVTYTAVDGSGNSASAGAVVFVPHDLGGGVATLATPPGSPNCRDVDSENPAAVPWFSPPDSGRVRCSVRELTG